MKNLTILIALVLIAYIAGLLPLLFSQMATVLLPALAVMALAVLGASVKVIARLYIERCRDRAIDENEVAV